MSLRPQNQNSIVLKTGVLKTGVLKTGDQYSMSVVGDAIPAAVQLDALKDEFRKTLSTVECVDKLTKLYNRRYFEKAFTDIWYSQQDSQECLSLIVCDVDFLKSYNNMYGYQQGDQLLIQIAQLLSTQLQTVSNSLLARYGADCFAMLLPNSLIDDAMVQTEAMLKAVKELDIPNAASSVSTVVTASFGIASTYPRPNLLKQDFFASAKAALDQAKAQGRNAAYTLPPAWSQDYVLN